MAPCGFGQQDTDGLNHILWGGSATQATIKWKVGFIYIFLLYAYNPPFLYPIGMKACVFHTPNLKSQP